MSKVIRFLVIILLESIVVGSAIWFLGHMFFNVTWEYFPYIRGWAIGFLIFDVTYEAFKFGTRGL